MKGASLSASEYYEILSTHVVPLLPGSELNKSPIASKKADVVLQEKLNSILIWPDPKWPYFFRLVRETYPFEADDVNIVKQFIRALREKLPTSGEPFFQYLVDRCSQDAVAWSVQNRIFSDDLLPGILTLFQKWASETYEGQRISVAIGVDPSPDASRISNLHLQEIITQDFSKVLSNGLDTVMILSPSGHVIEHLALAEDSIANGHQTEQWVAPRRYLPLARWATGGRVALALNRHGEILVFKSSRLQFAYRRGKWSHFAHSAIIARMMKSSRERNLTRAVYATCLDVSFSRTGGCIAITKQKNQKKALDYLNRDDLLELAVTSKSALLDHLTSQPFDKIPRPIREEIAAMDGAIVLDHKGTITAAGAIVRVGGGSDGGGRRAAAKALSRLGLAIKVSSDGGITAFSDRGTKQNPEIAFEVSA
jgi:hypothetical protein